MDLTNSIKNAMELTRTLADLNAKISSADRNRLFVVDFFADWCGPCRFIAPIFEQFSTRFTNATFLKVNVDNSHDIRQQYGIRAMPTFVLIKRGLEVERIEGANPQALELAINRHYSSTPANPNAASDAERAFLQQFIHYADRAKLYSDLVYKTLAISLIPVDDLRKQAADENGVLNKLQLAKALLHWFKNDFFSWCDSPICEVCFKQTPKGKGLKGTPTPEEKESGADRVEVYCCTCGAEVRFPRYNDPAKLLETRKGRCGEWANCFALIATAMDFDVRFIYDITDHVWVELWIPECDNWIHCDPCENALDKPLLYEKGWGKKLSYVIAFGSDHVCDVTWRYSADHRKTLKLRRSVREPVLSNFLAKLNSRMEVGITPDRAKELRRRRVRELVEFLLVGQRPGDGETYGGRISGDLEYNCSEDCYSRGSETVKGWSAYANHNGSIQRKVESDWKMAYLCREESEVEGEAYWSINLCDVKVKSFRLQLFGKTIYENGSVVVTVCAGDVSFQL
ncbi:unnamed protein product [Nippostrongylus brasiliensis]|uniref:Peptide-N(4)-(N-acetyl-beta-glucosaminyl)asparagine amidase n=1 Tax=Nippostrongylus brasiliensis TaxID=27835 RepID=A0A0N4XUB2_NIPBR|nr:unnamed protein product [Nippostrongylus brasiliensis]